MNDFATADFPTNGKLVTQVGGWTMGINKHGTQKAIAWESAKFLIVAIPLQLIFGYICASIFRAAPCARAPSMRC